MLHHESGRHLPGINQWGNKREGVVPLFDSRVTGTTKHLQPKEYKNNSPHLVGCKLQFLRILLALSVWNLVVSLLKENLTNVSLYFDVKIVYFYQLGVNCCITPQRNEDSMDNSSRTMVHCSPKLRIICYLCAR